MLNMKSETKLRYRPCPDAVPALDQMQKQIDFIVLRLKSSTSMKEAEKLRLAYEAVLAHYFDLFFIGSDEPANAEQTEQPINQTEVDITTVPIRFETAIDCSESIEQLEVLKQTLIGLQSSLAPRSNKKSEPDSFQSQG